MEMYAPLDRQHATMVLSVDHHIHMHDVRSVHQLIVLLHHMGISRMVKLLLDMAPMKLLEK